MAGGTLRLVATAYNPYRNYFSEVVLPQIRGVHDPHLKK